MGNEQKIYSTNKYSKSPSRRPVFYPANIFTQVASYKSRLIYWPNRYLLSSHLIYNINSANFHLILWAMLKHWRFYQNLYVLKNRQQNFYSKVRRFEIRIALFLVLNEMKMRCRNIICWLMGLLVLIHGKPRPY